MKPRSAKSEALAFLGIAQRAGAVVTGTDAVRKALRKGEVRLLILAEDGAPGQKNKVIPLAEARGVRKMTVGSANELGAALGTGPLTAVGVIRNGFAEKILERLGSG